MAACSEAGGCFGEQLEPNNPLDYSFVTPGKQLYETIEGCQNKWTILNSQALFGYLNSRTDFDVYDFNVTAYDYLQALQLGPPFSNFAVPTVLVTFSVVPQACRNNLGTYFSYALVANPFALVSFTGPIPPTNYSTLPRRLAEQLPPGQIVLVVDDEQPDSGQDTDRSILTFGTDLIEEGHFSRFQTLP